MFTKLCVCKGECAIKVGNQILGGLDTAGEADEIGRDPGGGKLGIVHLAMRGIGVAQHLRAVCAEEIAEQLDKTGGSPALRRFQADFCADFFVCALRRWLCTEPVLSPDAFIAQMEASLKKAAAYLT